MKNTGQQYARDPSRITLELRAFIKLLCLCAVLTVSVYAQQSQLPVYNFDDIQSAGAPQTITNIQRSNGTVTANLGGNLTVPGGDHLGLINVTISTGDTSFAGTFVVQSGSGGSTLTWNQSGPNTDILTPTGTVIARGWGLCSGPSCAGGSGTPTATSQTFANATPSLDGGSMLLSETGPNFSDTGWFYNAGPLDTANSFTLDLQFNVAPGQNIQSVEFDQFQYLKQTGGQVTADTKLFFGTQCLTEGTGGTNSWQVWDVYQGQLPQTSGWIDTRVPCNYIKSLTQFNHLTINVHRVPGDTSCGGSDPRIPAFSGPCMYYDSITLSGTVVVSNVKTSSGALISQNNQPTEEQTGLFIQLDTNQACGSPCTISENIDQGTFLASSTGPWWPAVQSLLLH